MISDMLANVEENTLYDIEVRTGGSVVKIRGMFDFVDSQNNRIGFEPSANRNILMQFDCEDILSVEGAEGPEGD